MARGWATGANRVPLRGSDHQVWPLRVACRRRPAIGNGGMAHGWRTLGRASPRSSASRSAEKRSSANKKSSGAKQKRIGAKKRSGAKQKSAKGKKTRRRHVLLILHTWC